MCIVITGALRANDPVGGRRVAIALVALQLLAATNHAVAAVQTHAMLNAVMSAVNYGCALPWLFAADLYLSGPLPAMNKKWRALVCR
jgi:hypothetical protein